MLVQLKRLLHTGSEIEIVVPVEPCELYDFSLKIINPQGKEIGKVDNIDLKSLADIDDFVPPPLTSVVMVDYLMGGKFQVYPILKFRCSWKDIDFQINDNFLR